MRVLFHHPCGPWLRQQLAALESDQLTIDVVADADGPDLERALATADVLLHVLHPVSDAMMALAPNLKLIQKIGVGLDAIGLEAARTRQIAVCNMPGTNTQAVVELTIGLMLNVLRRISSLDHQLRVDGAWTLPLSSQGQFGEISGKVVGLVGYGQVARRLEVVLDALGATVLINSRTPVTPVIGTYATQQVLLQQSDIISLHIPETAETRNWLNAKAIGQMKPGAVVINTARGQLIDEQAMIAALESGHLAGAGLDVFEQEPLDPESAILSAPNVVTLPHVAWLTRETLQRSLKVAHENITRLRQGHELLNRHV